MINYSTVSQVIDENITIIKEITESDFGDFEIPNGKLKVNESVFITPKLYDTEYISKCEFANSTGDVIWSINSKEGDTNTLLIKDESTGKYPISFSSNNSISDTLFLVDVDGTINVEKIYALKYYFSNGKSIFQDTIFTGTPYFSGGATITNATIATANVTGNLIVYGKNITGKFNDNTDDTFGNRTLIKSNLGTNTKLVIVPAGENTLAETQISLYNKYLNDEYVNYYPRFSLIFDNTRCDFKSNGGTSGNDPLPLEFRMQKISAGTTIVKSSIYVRGDYSLDSSKFGYVGINTTSPSYHLDVNGNINCKKVLIEGNELQPVVNNTTNNYYSTSSVDGLSGGTISSDTYITGKLGVNTTTPATNLDVNGSVRANNISCTSSSSSAFTGTINASGGIITKKITGGVDTRAIYFSENQDFIGINNNTPKFTLDVNGNINCDRLYLDTNSYLYISGGTLKANINGTDKIITLT